MNTEDDFVAKMYEDLHKWEVEVQAHNDAMVAQTGADPKDFDQLMEYCRVTDKIEIVDKPLGMLQAGESCGVFKKIWVDQWTVGDSGDSYAGFVYAKYSKNKYLKIPYDC